MFCLRAWSCRTRCTRQRHDIVRSLPGLSSSTSVGLWGGCCREHKGCGHPGLEAAAQRRSRRRWELLCKRLRFVHCIKWGTIQSGELGLCQTCPRQPIKLKLAKTTTQVCWSSHTAAASNVPLAYLLGARWSHLCGICWWWSVPTASKVTQCSTCDSRRV